MTRAAPRRGPVDVGATIEHCAPVSTSSVSQPCDAPYTDGANEDCCESTVTETRSEGSWTHDENGVLFEMPSVDERTEEGECD